MYRLGGIQVKQISQPECSRGKDRNQSQAPCSKRASKRWNSPPTEKSNRGSCNGCRERIREQVARSRTEELSYPPGPWGVKTGRPEAPSKR